ncbi:MAG: hypothetical protein U1F67_24895 [Rubrivivax sp.]
MTRPDDNPSTQPMTEAQQLPAAPGARTCTGGGAAVRGHHRLIEESTAVAAAPRLPRQPPLPRRKHRHRRRRPLRRQPATASRASSRLERLAAGLVLHQRSERRWRNFFRACWFGLALAVAWAPLRLQGRAGGDELAAHGAVELRGEVAPDTEPAPSCCSAR